MKFIQRPFAARLAAFFTALLLTATLLGQGAAQARPAPITVDGLWCGSGLLRDFSLRLAQHYQEVNGTLMRRDRVRELTGRLEGNTLHTETTKVGALVLQVEGDALRVVGGDGQLALARGLSFNRARGESCT